MSFEKILCTNRKARYDYEVLDTIEAGIVLHGFEVKSLRDHKASLDGAYAVVENDEVWLINAHIDEYKNTKNNFTKQEPKRKRKLLLHRSEIAKFAEKAEEKGHTLIPLSFYVSNNKIKVQLAVCKGKQNYDKRQTIKDRDAARELKDF